MVDLLCETLSNNFKKYSLQVERVDPFLGQPTYTKSNTTAKDAWGETVLLLDKFNGFQRSPSLNII